MAIQKTINYGGCIPVLQQVIGGYEIISSAYNLITDSCKKMNPTSKTKRFWKNISQLSIGCQRSIPIIGTVVSLALLNQKAAPVVRAESIFNEIDQNLDKSIKLGQGEYLIFLQDQENVTAPDKTTYEKAYAILQECAPAQLKEEELENRYEILSEKLKKINSSLKAVFIPKTLYEITYITRCIKEDYKAYEAKQEYTSCPVVTSKGNHIQAENVGKREKCWHLEKFPNTENSRFENEAVKAIIHRLNNKMIKEFKPTSTNFSLKQILRFTDDKIDYLKKHLNEDSKILESFGIVKESHANVQSATSYFGLANELGICNEEDAEIIRKAVKLDCSQIAAHSLFVYRGTNNFNSDTTLNRNGQCRSLSFGTSLFAGCSYDSGATAFKFIKKREGYVIPIPFQQVKDGLFYIPTAHTLVQLNGWGELFHARTRAWKDFDMYNLSGVYLPKKVFNEENITLLASERSKRELIEGFEEYKEDAISLHGHFDG